MLSLRQIKGDRSLWPNVLQKRPFLTLAEDPKIYEMILAEWEDPKNIELLMSKIKGIKYFVLPSFPYHPLAL